MIVTTTQGKEDRSKLLTATQEKALCRRIQANPSDYDAQDHIVRANIGLIRTIANKKQGNGVDVEDLVQEGCLALIKAAQQFNLSLNIRLSTYATWKISQAMQRCIENEGTLIRLPSYQHHKAHQLKKRRGDDQGYEAEESHTTTEIQRALHSVLSLDIPFNDEGTMSIGDVLPDTNESTEEIVLAQTIQENIETVLDQVLKPRERRVLLLRFGFVDDHDHTLEEIATRENLTRERVRQIQVKALLKLRLSPLTYRLLA